MIFGSSKAVIVWKVFKLLQVKNEKTVNNHLVSITLDFVVIDEYSHVPHD